MVSVKKINQNFIISGIEIEANLELSKKKDYEIVGKHVLGKEVEYLIQYKKK